jgi:hypothetical protein
MSNAVPQTRLQSPPDYYARGLALWPRLSPPRQDRVRRDPRRIAALVSRRTNLSYQAILALLGAPDDPAGTPDLDR